MRNQKRKVVYCNVRVIINSQLTHCYRCGQVLLVMTCEGRQYRSLYIFFSFYIRLLWACGKGFLNVLAQLHLHCTGYTQKYKNMRCYLQPKAANQAAHFTSHCSYTKGLSWLNFVWDQSLCSSSVSAYFIGRYRAFVQISIFSLKCPFKSTLTRLLKSALTRLLKSTLTLLLKSTLTRLLKSTLTLKSTLSVNLHSHFH